MTGPQPDPAETMHAPVSDYDTTTAVLAMLRARYSATNPGNGPRYVYAAGVRNQAGFGGWGPGGSRLRTADFVVMDTWPSKGLALHGHEVKVSRSDWLRELKDPDKAEAFRPYMDYWWLVVPDRAIVRDGELPDGWGLLVAVGKRLRAVVPAPRREAEPMPKGMMAAFLRAVGEDARAFGACRHREWVPL
ncbi:MAG TPA: hypothetical protein VFW64_12510 [Pseudonocardiaceae bacterium]|nr:hypothetical protein [Pseudonocardiaceae bacterium]